MKRTRGFMGMVLTAALLLTVGCGGAKNAPKSTEPAPTTAPTATAKTWAPEKPVTLIVPYSAGGSTDVLARQIEKVWTKYASQPLTVVNKPGASGWEGRDATARAKADGYTIMMGYGSGEDVIAPQLRTAPFKSIEDFTPLALFSTHSVLIVVPANSPYQTLTDLLAAAKTKPITAATSGVGNLMDITIRALAKTSGADITAVPFAGGGPATTAMVGGQVDFGPGHPSELMPHVKGGRLRILAVATPDRDPSLPEVKTLKELGVNFTNTGSMKGVAGPKGMPAEIVAFYEETFKKIAEDADFKKSMADAFQPVVYKNSKDFGALYKTTYDQFTTLIKDLKIEVK